jgi:release factor glutamine methyltransferase
MVRLGTVVLVRMAVLSSGYHHHGSSGCCSRGVTSFVVSQIGRYNTMRHHRHHRSKTITTAATFGIRLRSNPQPGTFQQQPCGFRLQINARYGKDRPYGRTTTLTTTTTILDAALESIHDDSESLDSSRFFNQTVRQTLFQARHEFIMAQRHLQNSQDKDQPMVDDDDDDDDDALEPNVSAAQLVALALSLPWDTGFCDLQRLLQHRRETDTVTQYYSESSLSLSLLPQQRLSLEQSQLLSGYMQRRLQFEPLQYICGQWDFWHYTFVVRPPLLCPRPETEQLVQLVLDDIDVITWRQQQRRNDSVCRVLDVGCGTGCIGIALAAAASPSSSSSLSTLANVHVTAIDVEPVAVATAAENAARILARYDTAGTDATLSTTTAPPANAFYHYESDRYRVAQIAAEDYTLNDDEQLYHVVVSNPPYIPAADMEGLHPMVRLYESRTALYGGSADGLHVIRGIVQQLPIWCHVNAICWLEVDPSHPPLLQQWLQSEQRQRTNSKRVEMVSVHQDFCGRDRFVKLRVVV